MTIHASSTVPAALPVVSPLRAWLPALASLGLACAVFGVVFWREVTEAVRVWIDSTAYNHCFLVLPLLGVLLWQRRAVIAALRPTAAPWALVLVPAIALFWIAAALVDILEAEQLAVIALFEVLLLAVLGWRAFQALLAPLLFLFFLVPFGAFVAPLLQNITTSMAVAGLQAVGVPVFNDGFLIQIPEGTFEVAEACAGLRFLIASIVFGCFFAILMYRSGLRRLLFILLSIALPILANSLRAFGLIMLGHLEGSAAAAMTDHVLYGWIFFSLVTLLLTAIGMSFAEHVDLPRPAAPAAPGSSAARIGVTAAAGVLLVIVAPTYLFAVDRAAAAPIPAVVLGPGPGNGWIAEPGLTPDWQPVVRGASRQSLATFRNGSRSATRFVALYRLPQRASPFTRSQIVDPKLWRVVQTGQTAAVLGGSRVTVNTALIFSQPRQRVVWWFYTLDGRTTASALEARLWQARAALEGGAHVGALVAVSTEADGTMPDDAILADFLSVLPPLSAMRPAAGGS